jgi:hypothetical protein
MGAFQHVLIISSPISMKLSEGITDPAVPALAILANRSCKLFVFTRCLKTASAMGDLHIFPVPRLIFL